MACFLVPTAEAIVTTIVKKSTKKEVVTAVWIGMVTAANAVVKRSTARVVNRG
ncbi:MAG: hypothetical protein LUF26_05595 [Firmicutes bacterium]|nr:hypothetical protein [Bacillota bacterium]